LRLAVFVLLAAASALAVDPFEIQVYDGSADAPGQAGLDDPRLRLLSAGPAVVEDLEE
jgi:hypothetical protein